MNDGVNRMTSVTANQISKRGRLLESLRTAQVCVVSDESVCRGNGQNVTSNISSQFYPFTIPPLLGSHSTHSRTTGPTDDGKGNYVVAPSIPQHMDVRSQTPIHPDFDSDSYSTNQFINQFENQSIRKNGRVMRGGTQNVSNQRNENQERERNVGAGSSLSSSGVSSHYLDIGDCNQICQYCGAIFWYEERVRKHFSGNQIRYNKCCKGGRVILSSSQDPPEYIKGLFRHKHFMENIRAYNQMFAMTSFGANIDEAINNGSGPYVFRIGGQIYHWMGSLCPPPGDVPCFLQLYIYDTSNEVSNRMLHFGGEQSSSLKAEIVQGLITFLDKHNQLVKLFRTARDKCSSSMIPEFRIRLYNPASQREYDLPTSDNIGAIVYETGPKCLNDYDVIIEPKDGVPQRINKLHPMYMSLQFPLLFIYGEQGFSTTLKQSDLHNCGTSRSQKVSMRMFYSYQLHDRFNLYSLIPRGGRLFQQYVVNAYVSIEQDRLDYIRLKQNDIRNEYLQGIHDAILRGDHDGSDVGTRTILPSSFTGGPRYMYKHYQDALAICRVHGNPQFFITFTCNVKWPEIIRFFDRFAELKVEDRADVVDRIFEMKVRSFIKFLKDNKTFGEVAAVLYTIEFQKRGLPHCHTLLWLTPSYKIEAAAEVDQFISAEIPDRNIDLEAFKGVTEIMMHGPCGLVKPNAVCMKNGSCSKQFPKAYQEQTYFHKDGFIRYKRRDSQIFVTRHGVKLDNSYVVPYNKDLLMAFNAHINVEYCGWSMMIKYLFKYISKGTDRTKARITRAIGDPSSSTTNQNEEINEIQDFIDTRFICPHEACWRIFEFDIHKREPAVQVLAVHLPEMQHITFRAGQRLQSIINDPDKKKTTLTEWLRHNSSTTEGHHLTYLEFPSQYVWYTQRKAWVKRIKTTQASIGRLTYIHPSCGDLFFLRMLLSHQKGCKSFQDIRTINRRIFPTFRVACDALGLLGDNKEWGIALEEASTWASAAELRSLFAHILIHCDVNDPLALWTDHWRKMADDIPRRISSALSIRNFHVNDTELQSYVLFEVEVILNSCSRSLSDLGLPTFAK